MIRLDHFQNITAAQWPPALSDVVRLSWRYYWYTNLSDGSVGGETGAQWQPAIKMVQPRVGPLLVPSSTLTFGPAVHIDGEKPRIWGEMSASDSASWYDTPFTSSSVRIVRDVWYNLGLATKEHPAALHVDLECPFSGDGRDSYVEITIDIFRGKKLTIEPSTAYRSSKWAVSGASTQSTFGFTKIFNYESGTHTWRIGTTADTAVFLEV